MSVEILIQRSDSIDPKFDKFSFDPGEKVYNALDRYLRNHNIPISLDNASYSFNVGSSSFPNNIGESKYFDEPLSKFVKAGSLLVIKKKDTEESKYKKEVLKFCDVSKKEGPTQKEFSDDAPDYRTVSKGLNIWGNCRNKRCEVFNNIVIVPLRKCKIDLGENIFDLELPCPVCENNVRPITAGFYMCRYKIYGKIIKEEKEVSIPEINEVANNQNSCSFYSPDTNEMAKYTQLVFEIIEIF